MQSKFLADGSLAECYNEALRLEKVGDWQRAAALYRQCLVLDPEDHGGASVRLASLGAAAAPPKAPDAYVATLFNQQAAEFDRILVEDLGYGVPMQLAGRFHELKLGPFQHMLDLGCGTGLSGLTLKASCTHTTGVDLAEAMIEEAYERGVYDALFVNEAVFFLEEWCRQNDRDPAGFPLFDLIVATDVLPYIGDLAPLFDGISHATSTSATLAFSCETIDNETFEKNGWSITPHQRFAHGRDYLVSELKRTGWTLVDCQPIRVRMESGKPIPGWLVIAWHGN